MDWKLFGSIFALVFLAELGDKTQLTAMAQTSLNPNGKWVVFAAASAALVLSTLVAVVAGAFLKEWVPEWVIKTVAGVLFLVFGGILLVNVWRSRGAEVAAAEPVEPQAVLARAADSAVLGFVLDAALTFERAAHDDYRALAAKAQDPALRRLFSDLADEEAEHGRRLESHKSSHLTALGEAHGAGALPAAAELGHDVSAGDREVLAHAREHEEATMRFYQELSRTVAIPALKDLFAALAAQERRHVERLTAAAG